jgi:hypothetical protein
MASRAQARRAAEDQAKEEGIVSRKRKVTITLATSRHIELAEGLVDDPYEPGAKLRVVRNVREHPVSHLHARGVLSESQRIAGEAFRSNYERAVLGGAKSIDYTEERVDGGLPAEPLSEAVQRAVDWLNDIARHSGCGMRGYAILTAVCGEGLGLQDTARRMRGSGCPGGRAGDGWVQGILVMSLEALIQHLGMEAVGRSSYKRPRDST